MNSIERRIERLEDYVPTKPEKLIALLSKLRGFKLRHGLGDNPSEEEVQEVLDRISNRRR